ncbi:hypothetical protein V8046_003680 [Vibrio parahaemolyticus]|uniref:Uncharacterized protein n=1 Tax=Vibrio alginolyticus TaxID=663 RepID=A0A7Y0MY87_VIBAL|nr:MULTISPECIES: hypothetical protein [Vibrio]EIA1624624.1 hypothetical protein [Vibrio parahaemolyticus]MDW1969962.1 hypothetical protein [Vibrio sp. 945]EIV8635945.1 hypothetical protein [Vibrio parahaemolyticus]EIZ1449448.1 hypothetical protein [Vibrio parahaemolyticus]EJF4459557.1 hypothetical protein [Vibrio parahaemolyticus]
MSRPNFEETIIIPPLLTDWQALPLITDTQYLEPLASNSLNRKFYGIVRAGIFRGFECAPAGGMKLRVSSGEEFGVALVERDDYILTVRQQHDIDVEIPAGATSYVVLEAFYKFGVKTKQVDLASDIEASEIKVLPLESVEDHHLILCRVTVPDTASQLESEHLNFDDRKQGGYDLEGHISHPDPHNQYAMRAEAKAHYADRENPHHVTKEQVGLGLVNNWAATSEINVDSDQLYATAKAIKLVHDKAVAAYNKTVEHWPYIAAGGETRIALPYEVPEVDAMSIQGIVQTKGSAWQFLKDTNEVEVAEPLEAGDEVVITLGSPSATSSTIIAELQEYIDKLESIINSGATGSPMEVFHSHFPNTSNTFAIPPAFAERAIKLVFLQGVQQSKDFAYTIVPDTGVIQFVDEIAAGTEITLVG